MKIVSVPLRGNGYEKQSGDTFSRYIELVEFPSPCGEMVMKNLKALCLRKILLTVFPSPCGEMVMKNVWVRSNIKKLLKLVSVPLRGNGYEKQSISRIPSEVSITFPSPCGEMVMKNDYDITDFFEATTSTSFRPLAGKWL